MAAISAQLVIRVQDKVRTIPLADSPFKIGRNPDNTLPLQHSLVSRQHAELRLESHGWTLIDLGSANGTLINGTRLLASQPRLLQSGDAIRIGPFEFTYQLVGAAQPDEPAEPGEAQPAKQAGEQPAEAGEGQPARETGVLPLPPPEPPITPPEPPLPPPAPPEGGEPAEQEQPAEPCFSAHALLSKEIMRPPQSAASRYMRFLPIIFQDDDFLRRYLLLFESIWEPLEDRQSHIDLYIDPRTCPTSFLGWLASWLDVGLNAHWPEARRRQLLAEAMNLYRWRGTNYGLTRMIEVCTGLTPTISDGEGLDPFVFRIRLTIPPGSGVDPVFVEDLIQAHKPAHAGYILELDQ